MIRRHQDHSPLSISQAAASTVLYSFTVRLPLVRQATALARVNSPPPLSLTRILRRCRPCLLDACCSFQIRMGSFDVWHVVRACNMHHLAAYTKLQRQEMAQEAGQLGGWAAPSAAAKQTPH